MDRPIQQRLRCGAGVQIQQPDTRPENQHHGENKDVVNRPAEQIQGAGSAGVSSGTGTNASALTDRLLIPLPARKMSADSPPLPASSVNRAWAAINAFEADQRLQPPDAGQRQRGGP